MSAIDPLGWLPVEPARGAHHAAHFAYLHGRTGAMLMLFARVMYGPATGDICKPPALRSEDVEWWWEFRSAGGMRAECPWAFGSPPKVLTWADEQIQRLAFYDQTLGESFDGDRS